MNQERRLRYFNNYIYGLLEPGVSDYDYKNKERCIQQHITYMLDRTQSMFKWNNLPDTIPQRVLELYLQLNGNVAFTQVDGEYYVFTGGMGGYPSVYYMPTQYVIANPALKFNKTLDIDEDCIIVKNDSMYLGLYPLFTKYASLMTEVELSMDIAVKNTRIISLITAPDDRTKASAEKFLSDVEEGKPGIIADNAFLDGIKSQPYGNASSRDNTLTSLIEMLQYLKASWYNELGLNANYNMKREAINTTESQLNNDALYPLIDNMMRCRKEGCEEINKKYGLDISVELDSSWYDNELETGLQQDILKAQAENSAQAEEMNNEDDTSAQAENEEGGDKDETSE